MRQVPASDWLSYNNMLAQTMNNVTVRYNRPVMITEVGMDWQQASTANKMMTNLLGKVKWLGDKGAGVFWWEPQAYPGWQGYTLASRSIRSDQ